MKPTGLIAWKGMASVLLCGALSAQPPVFRVAEGDWSEADNWSTGQLPPLGSTAIVGGGGLVDRVARVREPVQTPVGLLRLGNNQNGGILRIEEGGELRLFSLNMAVGPANARGTLEVTGGGLRIQDLTEAAFIQPNATARLVISGGSFHWGRHLFLSRPGSTAELVVRGSAARYIRGESVTIGPGADLVFELDADGVTPVEVDRYFNNQEGSRIVVRRGMFGGDLDERPVVLVHARKPMRAWSLQDVILEDFDEPLPQVIFTEDAILLAGAAAGVTPKTFPQPHAGPNFIIFLADDLGWQDTSLNDVDDPTPWATPNVDRLAAVSVNFHDGYASAPTCSPTRGALLTGKHPARTGLTHVYGGIPPSTRQQASHMDPWYPGRIDVGETTIADALRAAGYRTGVSGKWHVAVQHNAYPTAMDQGFTWMGRSLGVSARMLPDRLSDFATDDPEDPYRIGDDGYPYDATTEDALGFIEANKEHPFFLYLSHWLVHTPVQTRSRELLQKYCDLLGLPFPGDPGPFPQPGQRNPYYAAMVDKLDWSLGRVLDYLEATPDPRHPGKKLIETTYIIFSSDNGGVIQAAGEQITTNAPLSEGKASAWEGGVRVPFVIGGPGVGGPRTSREIVSLTDLFPTIMSLAGIEVDPEHKASLDGVDLTPYLLGHDDEVKAGDGLRRDTLFWHYPHTAALQSAMRRGDFKLLKNFRDNDYFLFRLYDEAGDRLDWEEAVDLAGQSPYEDVLADMAAELEAFFADTAAVAPYLNPGHDQVHLFPGHDRVPAFVEEGFNALSRNAYATYSAGPDWSPVVRAYLLYTPNGGGGYRDEEWFALEAQIDEDNGRVHAALPADATHFVFNLVDENNFLVSSTHIERTFPPTPASSFVPPVYPSVRHPDIHYEWFQEGMEGWHMRYPLFSGGMPFFGIHLPTGTWYYRNEPDLSGWAYSYVDGWFRYPLEEAVGDD